MGFWQYGLQGQNAFPTSGSVTRPYNVDEIHGCRIIGSVSLNTGVNIGDSYTVLLNTFSLGTQLYIRFTPAQVTYHVPPSQQAVEGVKHNGHLILRAKGGSEIDLGAFGDDNSLGYFTGNYQTFSIYYQNFHTSTIIDPLPPAKAFPRGGAGAGTNNQIACVCKSDGVYFYIVGFATKLTIGGTTYYYNNPAVYIGKISNEYLENKALFDPNEDGYKDDTVDEGPGGGVDGLPTAPTYPGTNIDFPELPTGASAFGFSRMNLYKPTAAQLGSALDILYSDSTESTLETIVESCKKWWYKPDQYCIGLMLSPVDASTSVSKNIKFGKYDSEVSAACVTDQYQVVDMGSVTVPLQYGSFLDFSGFAACKIFLPFIGFRSLNVDEVMGATVYCKYYVDMLTGSAVAMLKVARSSCNTSIYYSFDCNINVQVPLTANSYAQVVSSIIKAGTAAIGTAVTGGLAAGGAAAVARGLGVAGHGFAADLTQSGNLSSNNGVLGAFTPYICVEFPVASQPQGFNALKGKPSDSYTSLGSVSGYTVVDQVHLEGITSATDEEVKEIEQMLKSGVIF